MHRTTAPHAAVSTLPVFRELGFAAKGRGRQWSVIWRSAKASVVCDLAGFVVVSRQRRQDSTAKGNALVTRGPHMFYALKGQNGHGFSPYRAKVQMGDRPSQGVARGLLSIGTFGATSNQSMKPKSPNQRIEPMPRSAVSRRLQSRAIGAPLGMAHPGRSA